MASTITKFAHIQIPLEDVLKASNNFHRNNIISQGGFGPAYKGQLLWCGKLMKIAARRLDRRGGLGDSEFWTEVSMLYELKHTNLVSLIGFCDEKGEKIIITTYVANGSLGQFLNRPSLTWTQRLRICVGVARALSYLHSYEGRGYAVIHRFINNSTILLDENWEAKLSGFEISIKQSVHQKDRVLLCEPIGIMEYMDPETGNTKGVTHKSDIYSFGVVLFEILCGRRAYIKNETNRSLARLVKYHYENKTLKDIIHPDLCNQMSPHSLVKYSNAAYSCLKEERAQRPDTNYVVAELEKALELQLRHENLGKKLEHLKMPLSHIKLATDNFSDTYEIASWHYSTFYRVELDHFDKENPPSSEEGKSKGEHPKGHNTVIIKRYPSGHDDLYGEEQFFTEIETLAGVKHHNIVSLLGFCIEGSEMIVVTENVSNGYLSDYLREVNDKRTLSWEKRLKMCIDVAHALNYLHYEMEDQKTIINCDICSKNIGLDENFGAKIVDFGLSVFLPPNQEDEALYKQRFSYSSFSYLDPEYNSTGRIKRETDVYSFGVVLFEVLCGRLAFDPIYKKESDEGLAHVARQSFYTGTLENMIDPIIKEGTAKDNFVLNTGPNKESLHTFIEIAYQCVTRTQDQRPTMEVVIKELEKALIFQENNKDNLRMSLEDVKLATQNFHEDNCIGGRESFWKFYKGKVPQGDGFDTIVAKRFDTTLGQEEHQFFNELHVLLEYKHENVIGLVGYCAENDEKIIVYEYASRGSLDRYLDDASLTWVKRLNICIDVASALDFLHGGIGRKANVIHRDIKTANILVNHDWKAKLADFRISLVSPIYHVYLITPNQETYHVIDHVRGSPGYLDPLYEKSGILTKESDIYSFGVVLFEILCGRSTLAVEKHGGHYLSDFIKTKFEEGKRDEVVFEQIKEQIVPESLFTFETIAYQCLHHERKKRPTTNEVLVQLRKALEFQERVQCPNMDNQVIDKPHKTLGNLGNNLEHLKIPLSDIQSATNNFSEYIIADWNYSTLYRAQLNYFDKEYPSSVQGKDKSEQPKRCNTVVIKRISPGHELNLEEEFCKEIEMLSCVRHPNIVTLLGFCVEGFEKILVTENISNGYLAHYLGNFNNMLRTLTWEKRLKICIDVAHALNYLHFEMEDQKTIINFHISSRNIGLDENFGAKIVDFYFAVFLPPNQEDEALYIDMVGTPYYTDPEYVKSYKLKRESDVYGFGVVLLEILCGRLAKDPVYLKESKEGLVSVARRSFSMGTLEDMMDPTIKEETSENSFVLNRGPNKDSLHTFIKIANHCVAETQDQRPTMKVVVKELEKALFFQKNNKDNPKISLEDINQATQNFHKDNCIGRGGFGRVYRGNLQDGDGFKTIVAKQLDKKSDQGEQQFLCELQILLEYKHENIIGLVGYCDEKDEKIIVYEYASKGSLDRYLNNASLTWVKRLNICIDVASALDFLHGGVGKQSRVIHRDIKTANILVNDDWKAKLADFGLSLISPINQETDYVVDHVCGTPGYLDPLYRKTGFLTIESDIYSFGVVLFEILYGRSTYSIHKHRGDFLSGFIKNRFEEGKLDEVVFEQIREQIEPKSLTTFQKIAYKCLCHEREKRPSTKEVLAELKKALELQNMSSTMTKFSPLQIQLEDVLKATNNFHHDNINEHGGFGTTYKGQLMRSGRFMKIAAQRFDCKHVEADLEFLTEISVLSSLNHTNLVRIIGFCDEKDEKIIVTTYEAKRSLGQYLNSPNLTWTQRLRICVGVARALRYLHYEEGRNYVIIHCNINSDTILLDENLEAKLFGFEYSIKQFYKDQVCLYEHIGVMGYMDPTTEKTGDVTHKSDIYSFGVVLFEILCGRKAFIQNESNRFLASLAKYHYENKTLDDIIHPDVYWNLLSPQSLLKYSNVAYSCLNEDRAHRPCMDYIIEELEKALELQLRVEIYGKNLEHLKIPLSDIQSATNNFSETNTVASWDRYTLYQTELDHFDKENHSSVEGNNKSEHPKRRSSVIIKRYSSARVAYGEELFFTEMEMLTSVKHPNIVTLLGFCIEGSEMILVIGSVSKGYLGDYLVNINNMRNILTWEIRLKICIDVARTLSYLHSEMEGQKMIINRDICSYNIGLDENWVAKIVDFGLSVFLPPNQEDEALYLKWIGKLSYTDPEYEMTGKLKRESDVYSFGVVLFEILCGRIAIDPIYRTESVKGLIPIVRRSFNMGTLEDMINPIIKEETSENNFALNRGPNKDSIHTFIKIAYQCVAETQDQRPTMKTVVKELEKALFFQVNKDNPRIPVEDIHAKSDYVEEKSHASITETQEVMLSTELNSMTMTGKSGNSEIHNEEKL